jgi:hypothetical protein
MTTVKILNLVSIISPNVTKYIDLFNCSDRSLTNRDGCSNIILYITRAIDKYHETLKHFKMLLSNK